MFAEAEPANHAADSILSSPGTPGHTVVAEEVNTNHIVERDGGASCQLDENQLPTMDVSLDQKGHNSCCKAKNRNTIDKQTMLEAVLVF